MLNLSPAFPPASPTKAELSLFILLANLYFLHQGEFETG